ncbi:hypothetical protein [Pseudomonas sp. P1.8]|uniref:hypothetical protein n=1 Tax=Pseudomonas sp. P1.8 TaxID=1699310 RepID=UPI00069F71AC|nr:hypothetical protein [Pseudomonas sp. P1.8]
MQNRVGQTISASTFWQIWANTWIGENRGGLLGSGRLANLYGCAFGGNCASAAGLATTAGDNHFLYLQQPKTCLVQWMRGRTGRASARTPGCMSTT